MGVSRYSLRAFVLEALTPKVLDAGAFEEWRALDPHLAEFVDSGKVKVRVLDERAARNHAKAVYIERMHFALGDGDSRLAPTPPRSESAASATAFAISSVPVALRAPSQVAPQATSRASSRGSLGA